ncbi:MAG: glycosyl transferase, partial [Pseudorhodobacter sp.]|nr:glycosyl transferase [Pseudorhodobacter sp.]
MSAPRLHPWPRGAVVEWAVHAPQPPILPDRDPRSAPQICPTAQTLAATLLGEGLVAAHDMVQALALHSRQRGRLADILIARRMIAEVDLFAALTRHWQAGMIDPARQPPDPRLIDRLGAAACLRDGLLPWRRMGAVTVIATAFPEDFARRRAQLEACFGPVMMALVPNGALEAAILAARGAALDHAARCRVAAPESCRDWGSGAARNWLWLVGLVALAAGVAAPLVLLFAITIWALLTLFFATLLKIAAALAALRRPA